MWLAIEMGLATRFPGGRKPGPQKAFERMQSETREIVGQARRELVEVGDNRGEQLKQLTHLALGVLEEIAALDFDSMTKEKLKLLKLKKDAVVTVLNAQIRVDETVLRPRRPEKLAPILAALLEAAECAGPPSVVPGPES
jgi:hypothetical protein